MSNLDNFNTCPRCNTPNPSIAKFCFQCGAQLKSNDVPVVCPKCHTPNAGKSSYCRTCGSKLVGGGITKICPRCTSEIDANSTICPKCGLTFAPTGTAIPAYSEDNAKKNRKVKPVSAEKVADHKGNAKGRTYGVFLTILSIALIWVILMPDFLRVDALFNAVPLLITGRPVSGYEYLLALIADITGGLIASYSVFDFIVMGSFALTLLSLAIELIKGIVLIIVGLQPKKANVLLFIVAIIVALASVVTFVSQDFIEALPFLSFIYPGVSGVNYFVTTGFTVVLPLGLLLLFLVSLIFKMTKKEYDIMTIQR